MTTFEIELKKRSQVLPVIWFALMSSIMIYLFLVETSFGEGEGSAGTVLPMALMALGSAVASFIIPKIMLSPQRVQGFLSAPAGQGQSPFKPVDGLSKAENDKLRLVGLCFTAYVIRWAITESIAIFGMLVAVQGGTKAQAYPFFVVSLVLFLLARPNLKKDLASVTLPPSL